MTADDIRKARQDRVASALAKANTKTGLFKRPGTTAVADPYPDHQAAFNDDQQYAAPHGNHCTRCDGPIVIGPNEPGPDQTPTEGYSVDDLDGICWACLEAVARCGEPEELPK